jgi:glycosyltransferase involved in cell wall biosynthesis
MAAQLMFICHSNYLPNGEIFDSHWAFTFEFFNRYFPKQYQVLRHSLYDGGQSRWYGQGVNGDYKVIPLLGGLPGTLRYVFEVAVNVLCLLYLLARSRLVVVAIDPLSALAPAILKKIGLPINLIFITPDFARQRFGNSLLNYCYFKIDQFCTEASDVNYVCAATVIEYKRRLYGPEVVSRMQHFPNVPPYWTVAPYQDLPKIPFRIIYVGMISSQINFVDVINAITELKEHWPELHLVIVGDGDQRANLERYVKSQQLDYVQLTGQLPYEQVMRQIAAAEIGIAMYVGELNYDEFRDSMKIREYQALGTIPLASRVAVANAREIQQYGSGLVIDNSPESIKQALEQIYGSPERRQELVVNCRRNHQIYQDKFDNFYRTIKSYA